MVSIPEAKEENIWVEPIVLGVFETKELAREVWKIDQKNVGYKSKDNSHLL